MNIASIFYQEKSNFINKEKVLKYRVFGKGEQCFSARVNKLRTQIDETPLECDASGGDIERERWRM